MTAPQTPAPVVGETLCTTCEHCLSHKGYPRYWLCQRFPRSAVDPINGCPLPAYHYVSDVRRLSPDLMHCPFWTEKRDESDRAVVEESIHGKSVTFKEKEAVE